VLKVDAVIVAVVQYGTTFKVTVIVDVEPSLVVHVTIIV
jgi:hypothetical protein